jgi:inosine/xanthosine triphosphate pyrophosphatase family protein
VTIAEISIEEKNALSHRGKAMRQLQCHLQQHRG